MPSAEEFHIPADLLAYTCSNSNFTMNNCISLSNILVFRKAFENLVNRQKMPDNAPVNESVAGAENALPFSDNRFPSG
jgi:hypothetical protein